MQQNNPLKKARPILPWRDLMRIGLGQLKLSPTEFWNSTPKELKSAIEGHLNCHIGHHNLEPITKKTLDELMQKFPD